MTNPDKWIRKGAIDAFGTPRPYNVYDMRVAGSNIPQAYIILSTQTKTEGLESKCGNGWDCTLLFDLVTRFTGTSNPGNREQVNDMEEFVMTKMLDFQVQGFDVFDIELESSTSLDTLTDTQNVFRQLVRYRILLNEN